MEKKILTIIPARGGSKGVPRKNIRPLRGKPLIAYAIEAAIGSGKIDRLVVSTEDEEIANTALRLGAEVIKRPEELAMDNILTEPVMLHTLSELEKTGYKPDYVSLLQCTSPFISSSVISKVVDKVTCEKFDSCFTAFLPSGFEFKWREGDNPGIVKPDHDLQHRPRRQDLPVVYHENGAFYITRASFFKKYQNRFGGSHAKISMVKMEEVESLQIDNEFDFWLAEKILGLKRWLK